MFTRHLLFDHFQFTLIHEPNIPGSYAILFFTASDFTSITSHIHNWVVFLLWLHLSGVISPLSSSNISDTYQPPTNLSFSVIPFCLFILFMGFSRQEYWSGLPLPSLVDQVLSKISSMTHPLWVALHSMAHGFTSSPSATASAMAHLKEALMPEPPWQLYRKLWKNSEQWACWYKNKTEKKLK